MKGSHTARLSGFFSVIRFEAAMTRSSSSPISCAILAGLQEDKQDDQSTRLPFLGWLLGEQRQHQQNEILVILEASKI